MSSQNEIDQLNKKLKEKDKLIKKLERSVADKKKECEIKVEELKDYYENIIGNMPGHVYWLDRNNVLLGCNDLQAKNVHLKSREEIVGKKTIDFYPKDQADKINEINLNVMRNGKSVTVEECVTLFNEEKCYLSKKVPLKDKNGKIIGLLGISFDITGQKDAETIKLEKARAEEEKKAAEKHAEDLNETIEFYEDIIARMPGHVYWLDRNNVYLGCNDIQAKSYNLKSRKNVIGKTNYDLPVSKQAKQLNEINKKVMRTGKPYIVEEYSEMATGPGMFLSQKVPLRNKQGDIIGLLGISFDITDRKNNEKLKIEKAKVEEARKTAEEYVIHLKALAGSIAHELRTPLLSIRAGIQGLEKYLPILIEAYQSANQKGLPVQPIRKAKLKTLYELTSLIHREISSSNLMIDMQIRNIYHDTDEKHFFSNQSMTEIITEAVDTYPLEPGQNKLIHWEPKADFRIYCNATFIKHVFWNLIKNALYAIQAARKGEIFIWLEIDKNEARVHFKDTSLGLSSEDAKQIFEEYYTNKEGGFGLGLTFCKQTIETIDGTIECRSEKDEYTEFIMRFPRTTIIDVDKF